MQLFSTDIDGTIYDGPESAERFASFWEKLQDSETPPLLVYNTGRSIEDAIQLIHCTRLPDPDYLIGGVGTCILDFRHDAEIEEWSQVLSDNWDISKIEKLVLRYSGEIEPQPEECQNPYKSSWFWRDQIDENIEGLRQAFISEEIEAQVVYSSSRDLDVLPVAANKGNAVSWLAARLEIAKNEITVAGDSGNDLSMFLVEKCEGIVVSNAEPGLLRSVPDELVFKANQPCVDGVIEGIRY
ncbi:MAG: HAD-IIB family hydrolase, partial [Verrucomicrobiota bacterium]